MLKEKDLQELQPEICCQNGQGITLQVVQNELQEKMAQAGIAISFYPEQVKYAGLLGGTENCLVAYHPDHKKDYFSIVIRIKHQGNVAYITVNVSGVSKLMKSDALRKQVLETAKIGWNRAGELHKDYNVLNDAASGAAFVGAAAIGIRHLIKGGSDKQKLEEEQHWYSSVCAMINRICGQ